jgi:F-type H+-transporting ATPase subunit alpha
VAGDLKLAYAQFEELESFARFGTRLDENTRKIIEHGRRIRACLKQPEFQPVTVPGQIAILLALTGRLFDSVPLEKMREAELALRKAAEIFPVDMVKRITSVEELKDGDREAILQIAHEALSPFQNSP